MSKEIDKTEKNEKTDEFLNNFSEFEPLIKKIPDNFTDKDIEEILSKLPKNKISLKSRVVKSINEKTKLGIRNINKIANNSMKMVPVSYKLIQLRNNNPENEYFEYNNYIIENSDDGIFLIDEKQNKVIIASFRLNVIDCIIDNRDSGTKLYHVKTSDFFNGTCNVNYFLKKNDSKIFNAGLGRDIIKYIFSEKLKQIAVKDGVYVCGYDNGWYLPLDEDNSSYSIIWYTDEQRKVIDNCRIIYKSYNQKQKNKIIDRMKYFISATQISQGYLSIIIGWCMAAPFRLYFIKNFSLFPYLILEGTKHAGKTALLDFFGNYFYGHYDEHMSGTTASSLARLEDTMSACTFPRVIDEISNVKYNIIEMMKEAATSSSDYTRKVSPTEQISRPKIAPLAMTSNYLGSQFKDSANNSRAIVLNFDLTIVKDDTWKTLFKSLKNEKLFSFLYDFTDNWKDKNISKILKKVSLKYSNKDVDKTSWKNVKKIKSDSVGESKWEKDYPRLSETYRIILFGVYLFEEIFKIKLDVSNVLEILKKSRRTVSIDLLDRFLGFCILAIKYNPSDASSQSRYYKYLNHKLILKEIKRVKMYVFTQENLRDFNTYNRDIEEKKYSLTELYDLLKDSFIDKDAIEIKPVRLDDVIRRALVIKKDVLSSSVKERKINSITEFVDEKTYIKEREEFLDRLARKGEMITKSEEEIIKLEEEMMKAEEENIEKMIKDDIQKEKEKNEKILAESYGDVVDKDIDNE